jgi:hypothetical protein
LVIGDITVPITCLCKPLTGLKCEEGFSCVLSKVPGLHVIISTSKATSQEGFMQTTHPVVTCKCMKVQVKLIAIKLYLTITDQA